MMYENSIQLLETVLFHLAFNDGGESWCLVTDDRTSPQKSRLPFHHSVPHWCPTAGNEPLWE